MSSLVAPRPPGWRMHEQDERQGSLFGGEAFRPPERPRHQAPPRATPVPPEKTPQPADPVAPPESLAPPAPLDDLAPPPEATAAGELAAPAPREFVVPDEDAEEIRVSRGAGSVLIGPTLDDAVSRAWEGLVAGVPAACPVCHGEIEPALGGRLQGHCRSCNVTLD